MKQAKNDMRDATKKDSLVLTVIIYSFLFYSVWCIWEFRGKGAVDKAVGNELLAQFVKSGIIKGLVWVLPAVCLIRYFRDEVFIRQKEMFTNRVNLWKYLPVFLGFSLYLLLGAWITRGKLAISDSFGCKELIIVLFVGITEEMVFRGWLLNVTVRENRKWLPILINAGMFLLIHFPKWIASGTFLATMTSGNALTVPILSVIFSWTFLKSKNIWVPITLHMHWDLLVFLFY